MSILWFFPWLCTLGNVWRLLEQLIRRFIFHLKHGVVRGQGDVPLQGFVINGWIRFFIQTERVHIECLEVLAFGCVRRRLQERHYGGMCESEEPFTLRTNLYVFNICVVVDRLNEGGVAEIGRRSRNHEIHIRIRCDFESINNQRKSENHKLLDQWINVCYANPATKFIENNNSYFVVFLKAFSWNGVSYLGESPLSTILHVYTHLRSGSLMWP